MTDVTGRQVADRVARDSYGRLVAILAAATRDVAAAEDALADALCRALHLWPMRGVPERPEAWLLTTARRRLLDGHRHTAVEAAAADTLLMLTDEQAAEPQISTGGDRRLDLLFVCAHPDIDPGLRAPLMLQTVLGLDARRIGAAFLVAPATMGQRLVRAKARIRQAGIPFEVPDPAQLPGRLSAVLEAIYTAFGTGWDALADGTGDTGLAAEAIWLAEVLANLLPDEPEAWGLLALMRHAHARRAARRDPAGRYVPLAQQDPVAWDRPMIVSAEAALARASRLGRPGPFQIEAAIQSAHNGRGSGRAVPWAAITWLYGALVAMTGALGARVGQAAALVEAGDAAAGLAILDALPADRVAEYQPFWATRASVLAACGEASAAREAALRAAGLSADPAVRAWLLERFDQDPNQ